MVRDNKSNILLQAQILLDRLERISADSAWAHQASGIRASLARQLSGSGPAPQAINELLKRGFNILKKLPGKYPRINLPTQLFVLT
jgi:hypothetical protein